MACPNASILRRVISAACLVMISGCATFGALRGTAVPSGAHYVALGSSFAAGLGVSSSADQPPTRCGRSTDNYAHLLARDLGLRLTDASCSGATTAHLLGPWNELPAQLDALTPDTRLVTITIGGNDVGYIGTLGAASCRRVATPPPGTTGGKCPQPPKVVAADWTKLEAALSAIAAEVRRRAPAARLIFVDYLTIVPATEPCAAVPLSAEETAASRTTAQRLARITARVATRAKADIVKASALSRDHHPCSAAPWMNGFPLPGQRGFVPYHPNADGMAAIARVLGERLKS